MYTTKVEGLIPNWGTYGRQLIDVSLLHHWVFFFFPSLSLSPFLSINIFWWGFKKGGGVGKNPEKHHYLRERDGGGRAHWRDLEGVAWEGGGRTIKCEVKGAKGRSAFQTRENQHPASKTLEKSGKTKTKAYLLNLATNGLLGTFSGEMGQQPEWSGLKNEWQVSKWRFQQ